MTAETSSQTLTPQVSDNATYQQSRIYVAPQAVVVPPAAVGWREVLDAYLAADVDSPHTRRAYRRAITSAFSSLEIDALAELAGPQLAAVRASLLDSDSAPSSISLQLAALRSFLAWSRRMGAHRLSSDVVNTALRTPRASVRQPYQVLTDAEVSSLIAATDSPRDRALVILMLGSGLRVGELVALDVCDLAEDADGQMVVNVQRGKGQKSRQVPIRPEVGETLKHYLETTLRRLGSPGPLFLSQDRGATRRSRRRLTERAVGQLLVRLSAEAAIQAKRVSPHSLRHTFAIRCLRHGATVIAVSKLLGHASVTTTQRYVDHLALSELRAAIAPLS